MRNPAKKERKVLIALDIGNTTTHIGVYRGRRLIKEYRVEKSDIPKIVSILHKSGGRARKDILFCSVVPNISRRIRIFCKRIRAVDKVFEIGRNVHLEIRHKYSNIKKLGKDRLVNLFGAMVFYGCPSLVVDFGTAITMDYISKRGVFEGGLIIPGIRTSLDALIDKAALLPEVKLSQESSILGRSTKAGMVGGVIEGYSAMINELVRTFRKKYGKKIKAVATGGMLTLLERKTYEINRYDPTLTLRTLNLIYRNFLKS